MNSLIRLLLVLFITICSINAPAQSPYFYSAKKLDAAGKSIHTIYSKNGTRLINQQFDWIAANSWGWIFGWKDGLIKVYDSTGKYLHVDSIQTIHHIWKQVTLIPLQRNGKWGYYTKDGKLSIPHLYKDVTLFKNGKAAVKATGKIYFIDTTGSILPEQYKESTDYPFEKLSTAVGLTTFYNMPQETFKKADKVGLIEKSTRKILIEAIYDGIFSISADNVVVQKGSKYGVVNFAGKTIIPIDYEMIYLLD